MGWTDTVLENTAGAPWFWWALALALLIGLLLLGLKLLDLLPK